jgi:hypothetical protein
MNDELQKTYRQTNRQHSMLIVVFWVVMPCGLVRGFLKMEVICSSKTLVTTNKTTWCHNPEVHKVFIIPKETAQIHANE